MRFRNSIKKAMDQSLLERMSTAIGLRMRCNTSKLASKPIPKDLLLHPKLAKMIRILKTCLLLLTGVLKALQVR